MKRSNGLLFSFLLASPLSMAQSEVAARWEHYGGSLHGMQYSSLGQINRNNVRELEEVWRFRTGELGEGHREPFAFQANPILVERTPTFALAPWSVSASLSGATSPPSAFSSSSDRLRRP